MFVFDLLDNYHFGLDLATAAILSALAMAGIALRRIVVARCMWLPFGTLVVAYALMPSTVFSSWNADHRFPIALALVGIAATDWRVRSKAWARTLATSVALLFVARVSVIANAWHTYDRTYDEYRAALSSVACGGRVTGAIAYRGSARVMQRPPLNHVLAFVTLERDGFYPSFFGLAPNQPVMIRTPFDALAARSKNIAYRNDQLESASLLTERYPFAQEVLRDFDCILIVREGWFGAPIPDFLKPVFTGSEFRLFRIDLPEKTRR